MVWSAEWPAQRRPAQRKYLEPGQPMELRKNALFWLGQRGDWDVNELRDLYNGFNEREMREQVLFVLSQQRDSDAIDLLIEFARSETDVELRKNAIFWLSQTNDTRVADFLEELIDQ